MTDEAVAAPAAPESAPAPEVQDQPVQTPNPIESTGPEKQPEAKAPELEKKAEPKEEAKKPSASVNEALKKAEAKVKEEAAKAKVEPKPVDKQETPVEKAAEKPVEPKKEDGPTRDETGKFVAKDPAKVEAAQPQKTETPFRDPPARFKSDQAAMSEWEKAPESVRAATHRVMRELESGIEKYRQEVEPIKPYLDLAKQHNTSLPRAMDNYINLERTLLSDPMKGLQMVADYARINLREVAAKIMGQTPHQPHALEAENATLRNQVRAAEAKLAEFQRGEQDRQAREAESVVSQFSQAHPRFDELAEAIALEIKLLRQADPNMAGPQLLEQAYKRAELLNPAAPSFDASAQTRSAPIPDPAEAQTLIKGSKSVTGAPSAGSDPVTKRDRSPSIRAALQRAMAQAT